MKFDNKEVKEVHDASTSVLRKTKLTLHENVQEFDEDAYCCFEES